MDNPTRMTDSRLLQLTPHDNVAMATTPLSSGESITIDGVSVVLSQDVLTGHKVAMVSIAAGQKVIKYGLAIGSATAEIRPGDCVHTHNLESDYLPTYTLDGDNAYLQQDSLP